MLKYQISLCHTDDKTTISTEITSSESLTHATRIIPTKPQTSQLAKSIVSGMLQLKLQHDAWHSSSQSTIGSSSGSASSQDMQSFDNYMASASIPVRSHTLLIEAEHATHTEDAERKA